MNKDDIVFEILEDFDFEKTHEAALIFGLSWGEEGEIPSAFEMKKTARRLVQEAYDLAFENKNEAVFSATGGFQCEAFYNTKEKDLSIDLYYYIESSGMEIEINE